MSNSRFIASALMASATLLLSVASHAPDARANDTVAVLGAGGLALSVTQDISMEKEDLFISPSEVRVDYVFRNTSDQDIETVVAFPMPDISTYTTGMEAISNPDDENFMDFRVSQDGKTIKPSVQHRAIVNGLDVTDLVEAEGVPVFAMNNVASEQVAALSDETKADWESRGLLTRDYVNADSQETAQLVPAWKIRTTYWWKTTFPTGKPVAVHHAYKPGVGGISGLVFVGDDGKPSSSYAEYQYKYCVNDRFTKLLADKMASTRDAGGIYYFEKWLSYVLVTGANWDGPIGDFHLTVDKENPESLASFCGDGFTKTGPTTYEVHKQDFVPTRDLDILIVEKSDQGQ